MTPDERRVQAIERRHELRLLDRLLDEAKRPIPPPPRSPLPSAASAQATRSLLIQVMTLLATTYPPETRGGQGRIEPVGNVVPIHLRSTARSQEIRGSSTRSAQAIGGSL